MSINLWTFTIDFFLSKCFGLVFLNIDDVSIDLKVSILVHLDQELSLLESERDDEGVNINGTVRGFDVFRITISESDESIDFSLLTSFVPWADNKESSNNIAINKEINKSLLGINIGLI